MTKSSRKYNALYQWPHPVENKNLLGCFQIRVVAYDSCNPVQKSVALVRVEVSRNGDQPSFSQPTYAVNITETIAVGETIYTVTADDKDPVSLKNSCKCYVSGVIVHVQFWRFIAFSLVILFRYIPVLVFTNKCSIYNTTYGLKQSIKYLLIEDVLLYVCDVSTLLQGPAGTISYSLDTANSSPNNVDSYFYINPNSGAITVIGKIQDDPQDSSRYIVSYLKITFKYNRSIK